MLQDASSSWLFSPVCVGRRGWGLGGGGGEKGEGRGGEEGNRGGEGVIITILATPPG